VSLEALAEKGYSGQWMTPMKIKVLHLRAMVMCLWVPYLRWVTIGGSGESSIGSKTKLFEKVFSQEFRNLKLCFKFQVFDFFKSIVSARN
jgi:hypothetical protein